jgi:hypothetical protein
MRTNTKVLTMVACLVTVGWSLAAGQERMDMRALVELALDEPGKKITLQDVTILEAFERIADQTGIELQVRPEVLELLPYGAETRIREVTLSGQPMRQALRTLLGQLGMEYEVREGYLQVILTPVVSRQADPVTWDELRLLGNLRDLRPGTNQSDLESLRGLVRIKVAEPDAWAVISETMQRIGPGSADELLEAATEPYGWTWLLEDDHVDVVPIALQLQRQLDRRVNLRMSNRPLFDVLLAVGRDLGVAVRMEPSASAALPEETRTNFTLRADGLTGFETLDAISQATGLPYLVDPDGVIYYDPGQLNSTSAPAGQLPPADSAASPGRQDPYIGQVVVPLPDGSEVRWLVRQSEVPPNVLELRDQHLQRAFDILLQEAEDAAQQP